VDGPGWIPVAFSKSSLGSLLSTLPTDPINTTSSGFFYEYATNGSQWEQWATPESQKYKQIQQTNAVPGYFTQGANLSLVVTGYTGLVGWWPINEGSGGTANDSSGNGNNGSWYGTQAGTGGTYYTSGDNQTYAGYLDGSTDYVQIADINNLFDFPNTTFTVTGWFKTTNTSGSVRQTIIAKATNGLGGPAWFVGMYAGCGSGNNTSLIYFQKDSNNGCDNARNSAVLVNDGNWHNFAIVATTNTTNGSSQTVSVYVDGTLNEGSVSGSGNPYDPSTGQPVFVGKLSTNLYFFQGSIEGIRVYNYALTAAQVQTLYNLGR
jgi:hypothetical protein